MKLCINCKHHTLKGDISYCGHPGTVKSLLDGSPVNRCDDERKGGNCGPSGNNYETSLCCEVKEEGGYCKHERDEHRYSMLMLKIEKERNFERTDKLVHRYKELEELHDKSLQNICNWQIATAVCFVAFLVALVC